MQTSRSDESTRRLLIRWLSWMFLGTLLAALLIAQRYIVAAELPGGVAAGAFRWAMLIAHMCLTLGLGLLPTLLLLLVWPRLLPAALLGILSISAYLLLLLVDTEIYRLYRFHIDAGVLNLLLGGAARETFVLSWRMYLQAVGIAVLVCLGTTVLGVLAWRQVPRWRPNRALNFVVVGILSACLLSFHLVHVWADARGWVQFTQQTDILPLRWAATAKRFMRRMGVQVRMSPLSSDSAVGTPQSLAYPLHPVSCAPGEAAPNILLVVIDSWRFDAMNARVTPNIARLAERSSVFESHFSGGNATRIGVFSLFYSIPGTYWHQVLRERRGPVFIREILRRDYEVGVFRSAPLTSPEFDRTVFADLPQPRLRSDGLSSADRDRDLTADFKTFVRLRVDPQRPFFAFLFYDAPHKFEYPDDYPEPFRPTIEEGVNYFELRDHPPSRQFLNRYLNSVHFVDSLVGDALSSIESSGLLENTIVIVTGDHGQEFNETGGATWGHNSNFSRYQTEVPMVWYAPGGARQRYGHRTSHFDVMPTLLNGSLGCSLPLDSISVGRSMFESTPRDMLLMSGYSDFAVVQPEMITEVRRSGVYMLDAEYRPLPNATLAPQILAAVLEQRTRFHRKAGRTATQSTNLHSGAASSYRKP